MKQKGLILVFTGDGKGKTTAAMGTAMRMIAHGRRVGMVQFFKRTTRNAQRATKGQMLTVDLCALSSRETTGEVAAFRKLGSKFKMWSYGGGFTWQVSRAENQKAVVEAWSQCLKLLRDPKYDLVILDEIHIALKYKFLNMADVLKVLKARPSSQHVILTGRGAPRSILKKADLVTEMKCLKHPFQKGIPAQPGLDF